MCSRVVRQAAGMLLVKCRSDRVSRLCSKPSSGFPAQSKSQSLSRLTSQTPRYPCVHSHCAVPASRAAPLPRGPCTFTTAADSALSSDHCSELPFLGRSSCGFPNAPVTKSHMLSGLRDRNGLSCGSGGWKSETKVSAGCISSEASLLGLETVIISPCPLHELPHVHLCPRLLFFLRGHQPSWIRAHPQDLILT